MSDDKVEPIYGIYREKDGYTHMRLTHDTNEGLDEIANLTALDRDSAMEMVLDYYLEKIKPEFERLQRKKKRPQKSDQQDNQT